MRIDERRRKLIQYSALGTFAAAYQPLSALGEEAVSPKGMRITDARVQRVSFGRRTPPIRNAILTYSDLDFSIVRVFTNAGIVGVSFGGHRDIVEGPLRNQIVNEDPFNVERLWQKMFMGWRKPVAKGVEISSLGAVDIAIWDVIGKALNVPVYKVLGGFSNRIRVYAAGGYYQEGKGVRELVAEMEGYVREGFRAVKMKVGGAPLKEDVERVRAVREALGPEIDLMVDANNAWNAFEAIEFGRACEKYRLFWLEEPVKPDDIRGSLEVKAALDIPVASGENEYTRFGCRDLIEARAVDILQADPVTTGGITEWRKIAAMAGAYHIPMAPHGNPFMSAHLMASISNGLIMETYPSIEAEFHQLVPLFPVQASFIEVPDKPGLGIELDEAVVRKYEVK